MLQIYGCVRFKTWLQVYFWLIYLFERRSITFRFQNFVRNICSLKIMLAKSFATPHQENSINALRLPRVSASQLLAIQQLLLIRNNIIRLFRAETSTKQTQSKKKYTKMKQINNNFTLFDPFDELFLQSFSPISSIEDAARLVTSRKRWMFNIPRYPADRPRPAR